jgi:hypothetical protein
MANDLETPNFGNFSIQSTMEGVGNAELLSDLMTPETSTGNPDDIQDIDTPPIESPKKKSPTKDSDEPEKQEDSKKGIADFLYGTDEDEDEEEEDVPAKSVTKPSETITDEDEEDENNPFTAFARDLFKIGGFTVDDEEEEAPINTAEEFLERFNAEKKKGAINIVNEFIGQFGEDYQEAFQAIFVKGVNPKDYFGTYNAIESYAEMDLSNEANQVAVIRQALTDQEFDEDDIETEIEKLRNYGDLESTATRHHKVLVKKENSKLQKLEQEKEVQLKQQATYKQQYAQNVGTILQDKVKAKEFDGIPLNPKLAGELQDFLVTDRYKTPSGEMLTEFDRTILELKRPENHEMKVKVALLLKILEKDPTLSTIQKAGVTKKTDTLFGEVTRQSSKSAIKSNKSSSKPTSWWNN